VNYEIFQIIIFQLPITPAIQSQLHNSLINQQLQVISNGFQNLIMELQRILSYQEATWSNDQNADTHITTQAPSIISNYNSNENTTLPPNHTHLTLPQIIQLPQLQFTNETPNIIHRQRTQTLGKTVLDQKTITETASVPQKRKKGRNSVEPKKELICEHCQTTTTPEWRTGPSGPKTYYNKKYCSSNFLDYVIDADLDMLNMLREMLNLLPHLWYIYLHQQTIILFNINQIIMN